MPWARSRRFSRASCISVWICESMSWAFASSRPIHTSTEARLRVGGVYWRPMPFPLEPQATR
jgi:hypothetical protein